MHICMMYLSVVSIHLCIFDFNLFSDDSHPITVLKRVTFLQVSANIFEHMSRSRKVIVVLIRHYFNGMNEFELDQATTLYHDHELEDIIVTKLRDVPATRVPVYLYT